MKRLSKKSILVLGLLALLGLAQCAVKDWSDKTQADTALHSSQDCSSRVTKIESHWSGDCEASYATVVASAISDNLCIEWNQKSITNTEIRKIANLRVSAQEIICNCDECHQFPGEGCNGGSLEAVTNYINNKGFVGGTYVGDEFSNFKPTTGITWKAPFEWKYEKCLNFFKKYCEWVPSTGVDKCGDNNNNPPFDPTKHCGTGTGDDQKCAVSSTLKVKDVRQTRLVTLKKAGASNSEYKTALQKGVLISEMEIYSDIFEAKGDKVYVPLNGGSLGHYAVKIIGWEQDGDQFFWKVLTPFTKKVGNNGVIRVRGGLNIGNLELDVYKVEVATDIWTASG